jgi:hypothetical protein
MAHSKQELGASHDLNSPQISLSNIGQNPVSERRLSPYRRANTRFDTHRFLSPRGWTICTVSDKALLCGSLIEALRVHVRE